MNAGLNTIRQQAHTTVKRNLKSWLSLTHKTIEENGVTALLGLSIV